MVVMGDFNYGALTSYGRSKVQFIEHSFLLKQIIDNPTHITPTSQTLIDHMFISNHFTLYQVFYPPDLVIIFQYF